MEFIKETIIQLETNLDHLTGEEIGMALNFLNDLEETLDALYIPALGKKNRPAGILQVLCKPEQEDNVVLAVFHHTHTLGLRRKVIERYILPRETVCGPNGEKKYKEYKLEGHTYCRPEADYIKQQTVQLNIGAPALRMCKKTSD